MEHDKIFLLRAIKIAGDGILLGSGPFGAVIVNNGKIIAEASNSVVLNNDQTAHAEILAIRQASAALQNFDLRGCTLYSSCEPCPMCLGAIYWSGIQKVVYSSDRTDAEIAGFSDKLIYNEIMLDPSERKVSFVRLNESGSQEVFKKWDELANKISY
jgi:guanine deaminase